MKVVNKVVIAILALVISSCSSEPKKFEFGEVKDNVYTNYFFSMKMDIPQGWMYQDNFESEYLKQQGVQQIELEGSYASFPVDEIEDQTLLMLNKIDEITQLESGVSLIFMAENVNNSSIDTIDDYMKVSIEQFNTLDDFKVLNESYLEKEISGQTFKAIDYSFNYEGLVFTQTFYTTLKENFSFTATLTYQTKEEKQVLEKLLESMVFDEDLKRAAYGK